jgi:hypothetical protein
LFRFYFGDLSINLIQKKNYKPINFVIMSANKKETTLDFSIENPNQNVVLTITIGNAQIGGTRVRWQNSDSNVAKGKIVNLDLGKGSGVLGKTLELYTNILDVNPSTNGVVVTYFFHNCTPSIETLSDKVGSDGDVFSFITNVNFR